MGYGRSRFGDPLTAHKDFTWPHYAAAFDVQQPRGMQNDGRRLVLSETGDKREENCKQTAKLSHVSISGCAAEERLEHHILRPFFGARGERRHPVRVVHRDTRKFSFGVENVKVHIKVRIAAAV